MAKGQKPVDRMPARTRQTSPEQQSRQLWWVHILAMFVIALLISGGHYVGYLAQDNASKDEETINIAGRQRMLSQRILYAADKHIRLDNKQSALLLRDTLVQFSQGHDWLLAHALFNDDLEAMFFDPGGPELHRAVQNYISKASSLLSSNANPENARATFDALAQAGEQDLLQDLDHVVTLFEKAANDNKAGLLQIKIGSLILTLLAILAEVVFIFRPFWRTVAASLQRLEHDANHDALTGLYNRKSATERIEDFTQHARSTGSQFAVISIDLDGFKSINDALGHPAGDKVLQHVANLLTEHVARISPEAHHAVARLGGDEFIIALESTEPDPVRTIEMLADGLLEAAAAPFNIDVGTMSEKCVIGLSMGYAFAHESNFDADTLIANGDIALYVSKNSGKHRLTRFTPDMRNGAEQRHRLETDLRQAVFNGELRPHYEPQIHLETGELAGFDVSVSWLHPQRGILAEDSFMHIARDAHLDDMIDGIMALRALEDLSQMLERGHNVPAVSFNANHATLRDPDFALNILETCQMYGIQPGLLNIQVLETVLVSEQSEHVLETIEKLSAAGCRTTIDAFGTGYSSLKLISSLALTDLKIDRGLLSDKPDGRRDRLLSGAIAMGKNMGLDIVAVGVDRPEQVSRLAEMGCDKAQGHLFGHPMSLHDALDWLDTHQSTHHLRLAKG